MRRARHSLYAICCALQQKKKKINTKNQAEQTKKTTLQIALGQRRQSTARPFEVIDKQPTERIEQP